MTRKDYVLIAAALLKSKPEDIYANAVARHAWYASVSALAEAFKRDNPRFDATKFFDAAGVPS